MTIRKMTEEDLDPLRRLLADPGVMRYLEPPYTEEQTERFLRTAGLSDPPLVYAVEEQGRFLGYVICHAYDGESDEIGWVLFPEYWGKGYASALTERMIRNARASGRRLVIECDPEQRATRHIAEKFGFRQEGFAEGLLVYRL